MINRSTTFLDRARRHFGRRGVPVGTKSADGKKVKARDEEGAGQANWDKVEKSKRTKALDDQKTPKSKATKPAGTKSKPEKKPELTPEQAAKRKALVHKALERYESGESNRRVLEHKNTFELAKKLAETDPEGSNYVAALTKPNIKTTGAAIKQAQELLGVDRNSAITAVNEYAEFKYGDNAQAFIDFNNGKRPEGYWGSKDQPLWRPGANPTVDNVITRDGANGPEVLLIKRKDGTVEGGKWALPGGFIDTPSKKGERFMPGESPADAAVRELAEETGLDVSTIKESMKSVGTFGDPDGKVKGRDPRDNDESWSVSEAFALHLDPEQAKAVVEGQDDASEAKWVPLSEAEGMAFDHDKILEKATAEMPKPDPGQVEDSVVAEEPAAQPEQTESVAEAPIVPADAASPQIEESPPADSRLPSDKSDLDRAGAIAADLGRKWASGDQDAHSDHMDTIGSYRRELSGMKTDEVKSLAKNLGIRATGTKSEIAERIVDSIDEVFTSSHRASMASEDRKESSGPAESPQATPATTPQASTPEQTPVESKPEAPARPLSDASRAELSDIASAFGVKLTPQDDRKTAIDKISRAFNGEVEKTAEAIEPEVEEKAKKRGFDYTKAWQTARFAATVASLLSTPVSGPVGPLLAITFGTSYLLSPDSDEEKAELDRKDRAKRRRPRMSQFAEGSMSREELAQQIADRSMDWTEGLGPDETEVFNAMLTTLAVLHRVDTIEKLDKLAESILPLVSHDQAEDAGLMRQSTTDKPDTFETVKEYCAGCVLFDDTEGERRYLLIRSSSPHKTWGFPKGHVEGKENARKTAIRELAEETGLTDANIEMMSELPFTSFQYQYRTPTGEVEKTVDLFACRYKSGDITLSDEHDMSEWAKFNDATMRLQFDNVRKALKEADTFINAATFTGNRGRRGFSSSTWRVKDVREISAGVFAEKVAESKWVAITESQYHEKRRQMSCAPAPDATPAMVPGSKKRDTYNADQMREAFPDGTHSVHGGKPVVKEAGEWVTDTKTEKDTKPEPKKEGRISKAVKGASKAVGKVAKEAYELTPISDAMRNKVVQKAMKAANGFATASNAILKETGASEKVVKGAYWACTIGDYLVPGIPAVSIATALAASVINPKAPIRVVKKALQALKDRRAAKSGEKAGKMAQVAVYGYCPQCGAPGVSRERRPNGDDRCENGHVYPSRNATEQDLRSSTLVDDMRKIVDAAQETGDPEMFVSLVTILRADGGATIDEAIEVARDTMDNESASK